jgi:hypothetical protein
MWKRTTKSFQKRVAPLSSYPRRFQRKRWLELHYVLASLALTLCESIVLAQDQPGVTTVINSEQFISGTQNRVVFDKEPFLGDSGRCRSVFRGMPITDSGLMAITIPG